VHSIHISYFSNQPFNTQFYKLWLLTTSHQMILKNIWETVFWCKGVFCLHGWTVFTSIWPAGRSKNSMVDSWGWCRVRRNALEWL